MRGLRQLVGVLLIGGMVAAGGVAYWAQRPSPDAQYLVNRLWAERLPRHERDLVHFFVAIEDGGQRVGAAILASNWRQRTELYRFRLDGNRLHTEWPQEQKRASFEVNTTKCKAPEPFTLCLELRHKGGRTARFYSREDWALDNLDDDSIPAQVKAAAQLSAAQLSTPEEELPACSDCEDELPAALYRASLG